MESTSPSDGLGTGPSEAEPFWSGFLKGFVKRGLKGVKLVISDAYEGLRHALTRALSGARLRRPRPLDGLVGRRPQNADDLRPALERAKSQVKKGMPALVDAVTQHR